MKKHTLARLAAVLVAALFLAAPAFAQTATTSTTLSSAVSDSSSTTIVVANATGFTASSTFAYVDRELMAVRGVSSTTISVIRGVNGSLAAPHASGAVVYVGPLQAFIGYDPSGSCTAANYQYLPVINPANGVLWNCNNSLWVGTDLDRIQALIGRTSVVNTAYTVKPTDQLIAVTSVVAPGVAITLPSASTVPIGKVIVIKDESGLLVVGTNTVITVSATANQLEANTNQALITTAYSFIKLYSNGTSWLRIW